MGEDPRTRLGGELGERIAAELEVLSDEEVARLAEAIAAARKAERRDLREAAEKSLDVVPRFVRGAVKKVVFK